MSKKFLSIFIALVLIITALCGFSVSAEENTSNISVYSGKKDNNFWLEKLDSGVTEATIMTADQLMAFADVSHSFNFNGWTIKLGADMVINTGDASDWATTAPQYTWKCSTGWGNRFAGDFDGQGHVISGLYSNYDQECGLFGTIAGGNTIQNVSVVNSYFEYTTESASNSCHIGGIVGYIDAYEHDNLTTTIKNVYVNATLYTDCTVIPSENPSRVGVGGIVGTAGNTSYHSYVFENVAFEGNITSTYRNTGGLIGAIFHNTDGVATVNGCYIKANISSSDTSGDVDAGGLVGICNRTNLTVEDCIIRGTMTVARDLSTSAFVGYVNVSNALKEISADRVLLALRPLATGESGDIIYQTMLFRTWPNSELNVNFANIKYDSDLYDYPSGMKHIHKAGGDGNVTNQDFTATGAPTAELKGQAVFTGWTAVEGDYPIPAGVTIPTIDLDAYKNAVATTPTPGTDGNGSDNSGNDSGSNNNNNNNNNNNSGSSTTTTAPAKTDAPATEATDEAKGGCGSSVGFVGISVLALAAVATITLSKKKVKN